MLFLVRLLLTLHITISFSNVICKQSFFSLNNGYNYGFDYNYLYKCNSDYDHDHVMKQNMIMMTMVVIKKFTHYMSIATKTMTKFLKKV